MNVLQAVLANGFLQLALAAGLVSAVGCGVVGSLVVVRRITFLAGGIAHAVLGGMGVAHLLGVDPIAGAAVAAVVAALLVGWIGLKARQREDVLIASVWAIGMAIGIVAIAHTPGYSTDLMSYLLGNLLMITPAQVWAMAVLDLLMLTVLVALYRPLVATVFDEEFARVRGLPTTALYLGLLVVVALAVVVLVQAVGLVLVMALLALPAATMLLWATSIGRLMLGATAVAALVIVVGLGLAFETDSPAGATIVLCAAALYLAAIALKWVAARLQRRAGLSRGPAASR